MSALLLQLPLPLPLLASPPTALLLTLIPLPPPLQVFERKDWEQLLGRSIVPKLAFALQQELAINPLHQELEPFNWVLTWQDVMPLNQASPAGWVGWLGGPAGWVGCAQYAVHSAKMPADMRCGGCSASCLAPLRSAPVPSLTPHVFQTVPPPPVLPPVLPCSWPPCSSSTSSPSGTPCCATGCPTAPITTKLRDGEAGEWSLV